MNAVGSGVVRNGHLPERRVQTGIGELAVKAPRVRDHAGELKQRGLRIE
jgi:hypothetical protein